MGKTKRPEGTLSPAPGSPTPEYMYESINEYEAIVGFKVNEAFRAGWAMARMRMPEVSENKTAELRPSGKKSNE